MDSKKICFIMCVNNEQYMEEALYYINRLNVPEGYSIDCLTIAEAPCMTAGYNEAMHASDAKYKVYLHQDVMIVEKDFIKNILNIFEDPAIGMIGMVGAPTMPQNAILLRAPRIGKIYSSNVYKSVVATFGEEIPGSYGSVAAIDGLLMATQYDIEWREDILKGWDYYDISQSFEFRRQGYKVVIPRMENPWVLHDDGFMNLKNYFGTRKAFINEYAKDNWEHL